MYTIKRFEPTDGGQYLLTVENQLGAVLEITVDASSVSREELRKLIRTQANTGLGSLGAWATWTADEVVDYINDNVDDLPKMINVLKKIGQMLVCLRDMTLAEQALEK